jgi:hypothetical protein
MRMIHRMALSWSTDVSAAEWLTERIVGGRRCPGQPARLSDGVTWDSDRRNL